MAEIPTIDLTPEQVLKAGTKNKNWVKYINCKIAGIEGLPPHHIVTDLKLQLQRFIPASSSWEDVGDATAIMCIVSYIFSSILLISYTNYSPTSSSFTYPPPAPHNPFSNSLFLTSTGHEIQDFRGWCVCFQIPFRERTPRSILLQEGK